VTTQLVVDKPGVLASIQDLGRFGYRRFGVPQSGVLQPDFAKIANVLAGNPEDTAVIEFLLTGPTFHLANGSLRLAIAGDCYVKLTRHGDRRMFRAWRSINLQAGDFLEIGNVLSGKAGYIAISGGFDLVPVMGSHATYLRAGFGGLDGNPLRAGTILPLKSKSATKGSNFFLPTPPLAELPSSHQESIDRFGPATIHVILGPQDDYFTEKALRDFFHGVYTVTRESDRMGSRLEGPVLTHRPDMSSEIISDGMVPGAIQVPGNGAPIVMLADGPTVGGYPKIATVISTDLPKLAVMTPGSMITFEEVTLEEAEARLQATKERLTALLATITPLPQISEPF